jgi:hypothetical protein
MEFNRTLDMESSSENTGCKKEFHGTLDVKGILTEQWM